MGSGGVDRVEWLCCFKLKQTLEKPRLGKVAFCTRELMFPPLSFYSGSQ